MSVNTIGGSRAAAGATCSSCGTTEDWNGSSWCPVCGYYPALNRAVPDAQPEAAQDGYGEEEATGLPIWAFVALIGVAAILVIAVVLRVVVPDGPRGFVAMGMMGFGFVMFVVAHGLAVVTALKGTATFSIFDVVANPVEIWRQTFLQIDDGHRKIWFAVWGLVCGVSGFLIVGGIDYDLLFEDWGVAKREKSNLMKQIVQTASAAGGAEPAQDMTLEEAMEELAGQAHSGAALDEQAGNGDGGEDAASGSDGSGSGEKDDEKKKEEEDREPKLDENGNPIGVSDEKLAIDYLPTVDCAVMGYCPRSDGSIRCLIVAGVVNGELRCLGQCSVDSLDEVTRQKMAKLLELLSRRTPFIHTFYDATWVEPKVRVRVAFTALIEGKRLRAARVKEVLPNVGAEKSKKP